MLKKKLVKLGILALGLGGLIATSRPARAIVVCCSECDTLLETCITNFPHNVSGCTTGYNNCERTCIPNC